MRSSLPRRLSGDVAVGDALCQAFHDGCFAHARLADEHGVVLRAAREHLDGAADFLVSADHGIELVLGGEAGEIAGVAAESVKSGLRVWGRSHGGCREPRRWLRAAACG